MAKVSPFHSKIEEEPQRDVHCDNDACSEGKKIRLYISGSGTKGKPVRKACEEL